jgi:hypothetical protein
MNLIGLGVDSTGKPLFRRVDEEKFADRIFSMVRRKAPLMKKMVQAVTPGVTFKAELERKPSVDLNDAKSAGWTYLVNGKDPRRKLVENFLDPLAQHRTGGSVIPLLYHGEKPEEWINWLQDNYYTMHLAGQKPPHFILIVGSPKQVPFHFQSLLDTVASVGRLDFEDPTELRTYVEKVIRLDQQATPANVKEAVFFATDGGLQDPTYFSRKYMAEPLADHTESYLKFQTIRLMGREATKANLLDVFKNTKAAIVYTASHGLGAFNLSTKEQLKLNGSICCQTRSGEGLTFDHLVNADSIPLDQPFLEGAAFFQFACFGYGTPAESDYEHWFTKKPLHYGKEDFTAALPKKLLSHPRGPLIYIGHLDTAFLHAFLDPDDRFIVERWHPRIVPFKAALESLLNVEPCGRSMEEMNNQYSIGNAHLANTYDRLRRDKSRWTQEMKIAFVNSWIRRSDAQNYLVFGDPSARLRISA